MKLLTWGFALLMVGLVASACGDSGKSDEEAIEELFKEAAGAINDADYGKLAGLAAAECGDLEEAIAQDIEGSRAAGFDFQFEVTGVDIRNLEEESAEALVLGTVLVDGEEERLEGDGKYVRVAKEDGEWKFADCDFFGTGAGDSP